ncbi:MAG TPA: hypothetical protein DCF63_20160 [Planctomycetaceae bacterium]|nr:hypothetical protein [Planctomycetaceae bacterium]
MQPLEPKDLLKRQGKEQPSNTVAYPSTVTQTRFQELERIVQELPLTVAPYLELAEIYMSASRWSDACRILEKAIHRFPEEQKALDWLEDSQIARAEQMVALSQSEYQSEPTELTREALHSSQLALNALKEKIYRHRLQRYPDRLQYALPLAHALQQLDRSDEAIEYLKQAAMQRELRAEACLQLGELLEKSRRIPEALSAYRRAALFRVPPPSAEIKLKSLQAAARLAQQHQLIDSARRYLEMLIELSPDDPRHAERLRALPAGF